MEKRPLSSFEKRAVELFGRYYGSLNTRLYRATGGKLGGTLMGAPVLLLTTIGHKSGQPRTSPLLYLRDAKRLIIVASKGGYPAHPAWYLNLMATPSVEVEVGAEKRSMLARTATREERAHYWPQLVSMYRAYETYQSRTDREIPVVVLEPQRAS